MKNITHLIIVVITLVSFSTTQLKADDHTGLIVGTIAGATIGAVAGDGDTGTLLISAGLGATAGYFIDKGREDSKSHYRRHSRHHYKSRKHHSRPYHKKPKHHRPSRRPRHCR